MMRLLLSTLLLAGCATGPAVLSLDAYPAALAGQYDNAVQFSAAPPDMKDPPDGPDEDWIDQQSVRFVPVSAPAVAPAAAYAEWVGAEGSVVKQRLWTFRAEAGGVRMDILEFREPSRFVGGDSNAFAGLTPDALKAPLPGCALLVTSGGAGAWNAATDPAACRAGDVEIDIRVTVMPTGILYQEQGRRADGAYAFRIPAPVPYEFRRR